MSLILDGTNGLSDVDGSAATPAIRGTDTNTGMFFPAADTIAFTEGGVESMRIDSAGNVGIGTSSPSYKLDVINNTTYQARFSSTTEAYGNGGILVGSNAPADPNYYGQILWTQSNTSFNLNAQSGILTFGTSLAGAAPSERMRIDSSGALLVGQTAQQAALFEVRRNSGSIAYLYNNAGTGAQLAAGNTAWSAVSDERKKDIIEPIQNAVDKINSLRTVIGKYKVDEETTRRSFLIAQDVQAVFPEAVTIQDDEDKTLLLQYTDLIPLLTAAIQELKAELDQAKAEIQALKETK